ncbi:tRNA pseudouridine synthase B [Anaerobacterium chartisolvens]|uniref:tRNA pseudouridine synthase B n=1 Tax=Anaerobacterium chartisolvens TaxID=1297424 RepID=A0A369AT51_9FIRM|nr:tRNA pseudouridine(55) synthase TruB [Anaerobacterium chartisolvens]RCX11407.1 tRNA pseudouridine synthase B [Anaerobacterium chartisolvens]
MNGILNVIKPPGMTSFDVVAYLRGILKIKKIGHTGTLDPDAAGVLPICVGKATRAIEYIIEKDKRYRAELTLGIETDTQDSSGRVVSVSEAVAGADEIERVMKDYVGKYSQLPPMYSAVKVDGRKLYELARKGITVERKPREVEIYSIEIIKMSENGRVLFDVDCSKGTYIRTLCSDIGRDLGCGGHMSFLIRTRAGSFDIGSALTLEEAASMAEKGEIGQMLAGAEEVFLHLKSLHLDRECEKKFLNGAAVPVNAADIKAGQAARVYGTEELFLGLGEIMQSDGEMFLKSKKLFI